MEHLGDRLRRRPDLHAPSTDLSASTSATRRSRETSDDFFTFEADNQSDGQGGDLRGQPSDRRTSAGRRQRRLRTRSPAIQATTAASSTPIRTPLGEPTGRSLAFESLRADHLTPSGNPSAYLFDGAFPIIYRRGSYSVPAPNCAQNATTLCLSSGRFQVKATFTTTQGQQGIAQATRLTADTGYFTFFDPSNVEVVVKVLNACAVNQKIWVFAGGLTNVATVITVTDTSTGVSKIYSNAQNTPFQPVQDTVAFGTCFAGSLAASADERMGIDESALARVTLGEVRALANERLSVPIVHPETEMACVTDAQTLCLSNNRYQVRTTWRTATGQTGSGNAVRLTADTGYFWFFDQNNVEMVLKVLNACGLNSRYWVFAGGLTNVQVTTTVTDTQTGQVKTYNNALNQAFLPLQDTGAFATCP